MNDNNQDHHVAWADRIGLPKQWSRDLEKCGETFGTPYYIDAVNRFRNHIINIKDGPQLSDILDNYIDTSIQEYKQGAFEYWQEKNPRDANIPEITIKIKQEIDYESHKMIEKYILQMLDDNGFGFYKSSFVEDEMS